jgi:hypothetical protein
MSATLKYDWQWGGTTLSVAKGVVIAQDHALPVGLGVPPNFLNSEVRSF